MMSRGGESELGGTDKLTCELSSQGTHRLRIGVILDSLVVPASVAKLVHDIQASEFLRLAVVVVHAPLSKSLWHRYSPRTWPTALFRLYEAMDYRLFNARRNALAPTDIAQDLADAEVLDLRRAGNVSHPHLEERDLARIRSADLDVLLDLGQGSCREALAKCARCGVWSIHHGDNRQYRGGPSLFWEMYDRNPVSGTEVQILTGGTEGSRVICRSFSTTNLLSLYLSRNGIYWKSAQLLMRRLRDLHRYGWNYIKALDSGTEPANGSNGSHGTPKNPLMTRFIVRSFLDLARRRTRHFFYKDQWLLAIRRRDSDGPSAQEAKGFRLIVPPDDRFYADPFIIKRDGTNYLFFEECRFDKPKGVISCLELDEAGNWTEPRVVLEKDYHLAYPCVFEWHGQIYLIPETFANGTIELYRAVQFPHRWVLERVLMENSHATDATLLEHHGKFWLFASPRVEGYPECDELDLFMADSPLGPWQAHPKNPIVADVRRARPAGRLFFVDGQLFRPAQDCSVRYGYAVSFNRVEVLSETEYREVLVGRIEPDWLPGNLATHTFNYNEGFEVLDARLLMAKRRLKWICPWKSPPVELLKQSDRNGCRIATPCTPAAGDIATGRLIMR